MRIIFAIPLLLAASPAIASPVYLECLIRDTIWNVTVDADAGTLTYIILSTSSTQRPPAFFTADKVYFNGMTIDRVTLSFAHGIGDNVSARGQCRVITVSSRQF